MGEIKIDDKTTVSLFAVLGAAPVIVGGILWLSSINSKADEALKKGDSCTILLQKVDRRLIRIETKLGTKPDNERDE